MTLKHIILVLIKVYQCSAFFRLFFFSKKDNFFDFLFALLGIKHFKNMFLNPTAIPQAETANNFGLAECNRVMRKDLFH